MTKLKGFIFINLLVAVFSLLPGSAEAHPFHVSMCEVRYNEEAQSLEIALKIFIDDLDLYFDKVGVTDQYFGEPGELATADSLLTGYLNKVFSIRVDGKSKTKNYLGKEIDKGALWAYFEVKNVAPFKTFGCSNSLFFELFDDQQNIIQLTYQDETRSLLLQKRNPSDQLTF